MKVSVVVCAKNDGKYLQKCLLLLQAQILRPEIIVIYGESIDNTRAVAKKHADVAVKDNGNGLTDARNIGWKIAKGEVVAYCDADALPDKNWTAKIARQFSSNPELLALSGPLGATSGKLKLRVAFRLWAELFPSLFAAIGHHNVWGANMAFRRSILEKFPFKAVFMEDFDIGQRLRRAGFDKRLRFDRKLKMVVSSRRFEKSFYRLTLKYYAINWLFMIFNKPPRYTYYKNK